MLLLLYWLLLLFAGSTEQKLGQNHRLSVGVCKQRKRARATQQLANREAKCANTNNEQDDDDNEDDDDEEETSRQQTEREY